MKNINLTPFEETLDETITVIREDFRSVIADYADADEVCLAIREELRVKDVDFIKIIALALAGEVARGTR